MQSTTWPALLLASLWSCPCHAPLAHNPPASCSTPTLLLLPQATALRMTRIVLGEGVPLGRLLRAIEDQSPKSCDTDKRGCGAMYPVTQVGRVQGTGGALPWAWGVPGISTLGRGRGPSSRG